MALPKGRPDARQAYETIIQKAEGARRQAHGVRVSALSGTCTARELVGFHNFLVNLEVEWMELAAIPGLEDYVREREGDPELDLIGAYTLAAGAGRQITAWIRENLIHTDNAEYAMWRHVEGQGMVNIEYDETALAPMVTLLEQFLTVVG